MGENITYIHIDIRTGDRLYKEWATQTWFQHLPQTLTFDSKINSVCSPSYMYIRKDGKFNGHRFYWHKKREGKSSLFVMWTVVIFHNRQYLQWFPWKSTGPKNVSGVIIQHSGWTKYTSHSDLSQCVSASQVSSFKLVVPRHRTCLFKGGKEASSDLIWPVK